MLPAEPSMVSPYSSSPAVGGAPSFATIGSTRPCPAAPATYRRTRPRQNWRSDGWRSQQVVEKPGEFADTFAFPGYDAVQLAAAHAAMTEGRSPLVIACFDRRLNKAASVLDMEVPAIP